MHKPIKSKLAAWFLIFPIIVFFAACGIHYALDQDWSLGICCEETIQRHYIVLDSMIARRSDFNFDGIENFHVQYLFSVQMSISLSVFSLFYCIFFIIKNRYNIKHQEHRGIVVLFCVLFTIFIIVFFHIYPNEASIYLKHNLPPSYDSVLFWRWFVGFGQIYFSMGIGVCLALLVNKYFLGHEQSEDIADRG